MEQRGMRDLQKYRGIIPAFYACYDDEGGISVERTKKFTQYLMDKGVKGLYVCGSSGECIYQGLEERKRTLEAVMEVAKGKITIIAHVGCNNTADSQELAAHAESLGVDAIASIPPIYFHLPDHAIAQYWNDISAAAPNTDFVIYNIPQLAGVALSLPLYQQMLENPRVIGVKNSSMPVQDIQMFKDIAGEDCVVFNGPDEQLVSGLAIGADGGIGGTYAVMPELYLKIKELVEKGDVATARDAQNHANRIIYKMCSCHGNLYAVMKEILKHKGMDLGGVRKPLTSVIEEDQSTIEECMWMIDAAIREFA
jgi:N-acetylneuraminate lyase